MITYPRISQPPYYAAGAEKYPLTVCHSGSRKSSDKAAASVGNGRTDPLPVQDDQAAFDLHLASASVASKKDSRVLALNAPNCSSANDGDRDHMILPMSWSLQLCISTL